MEGIAMNCNDHPDAVTYNGLRNQGSTCYLNSVLQVLFMTKEFRKAVNRHRCSANCDYIDPLLKRLFEALERSTTNTKLITKKLGITVNEQRDAAEYFEKILNNTNSDASQIFQGQLTHKNICTSCDNSTNTSDPFWSLPLRLEPNKEYNVEKGIENFFQNLDICGENQMYCETCDAKTDATIKTEMTHHPKVLTLLLKRFKFDYHHQEYVKIKQTVTVSDTLQIPESQSYELYAFVEHFGELRSGHYTVTIKSWDDDRWYTFNDSSVTLLQNQPFQLDKPLKSRTAYLLFYRKKKMHGAETLNQDNSKDFTAGAPNSEQCEQPIKCEEKHEGEEGADMHHSHVDNNYKKEVMNAGGDEDGDTQSSKQIKRKMNSTKNSHNECVEYGGNQTVRQNAQKRKGDNQKSGQEITEKSRRSGHLNKDAKNQQDKILGNVKHKTYSDNQDKLHEDEQYERMSQNRDKTDRTNPSYSNCREENSSAKNNAGKVAKESETKQSEREKQNASDKKGKGQKKSCQWSKLMSCGLCVPCKKD